MTPKELLYIEDALGHSKFISGQFNQAIGLLSDPVLKQQVQQLANRNQKLYTQFFGLV